MNQKIEDLDSNLQIITYVATAALTLSAITLILTVLNKRKNSA
ncbi:MAG: hypothetical protein Q9M91_02415 [Candidatus Dojkabacteria bacterium]|nr:hypothetical protein [Candidatus Dojkabacteria bacterium]MDQ7020679.1 hypothetical protein [Candidatus Dojkabacteria bacterium]